MRKCISGVVLAGLLLAAGTALALPKAEVFAGYQFTRFNGGVNANGWNAALTGKWNSFLGITADFSGAYRSGVTWHSYTFGPQVSAPLPVVRPFAHFLIGGITASASGAHSTAFDTMLGGGLDYGQGKPLSWRLIQVDWIILHNSGVTDRNNARLSTGIMLRF